MRQPLGTYTETGWEVFPQGLTDTLTWVKERYGDIPLYITENGAAFFDPPVAEGDRVRDPLRIDYLHKHIGAVQTAIDAGCDIRGYMVWSLLDNLEWSLGLFQALRHRARQLRHPAAHAEGQRALVQQRDRHARRRRWRIRFRDDGKHSSRRAPVFIFSRRPIPAW